MAQSKSVKSKNRQRQLNRKQQQKKHAVPLHKRRETNDAPPDKWLRPEGGELAGMSFMQDNAPPRTNIWIPGATMRERENNVSRLLAQQLVNW